MNVAGIGRKAIPAPGAREIAPEAGASPTFPISLSEAWRVSYSPQQWILERYHGNGRWYGRRFHRCRAPLLRSIRELCGAVDPAALEAVHSLPKVHPDMRLETLTRKEAGTTPARKP